MSRARDRRRAEADARKPEGWTPLQRMDNHPDFVPNPAIMEMRRRAGVPMDDEVWLNDLYQVTVRYLKPTTEGMAYGRQGMMHLSIHLDSRDPVRNWRHLQQIKNEVAGPRRTAVEIFPPEAKLVDTSNEYHLWVLPEGLNLPFGFDEGLVSNDQQVEEFNDAREAGIHRGRQEPWEPGLTTGRNEDTPPPDPRLGKHLKDLMADPHVEDEEDARQAQLRAEAGNLFDAED